MGNTGGNEPKIEVVLTTRDKILPLRHEILRNGYPLEASIYAQDLLHEAVHLAIQRDNEIICVCTVFPSRHEEAFTELNQYQLRGMACGASSRNQGFGKVLAMEAIKIAKERQAGLLWCNARKVAFNFYERLGFKYYGEYFNSVEDIPHKVMFLKLSSN